MGRPEACYETLQPDPGARHLLHKALEAYFFRA